MECDAPIREDTRLPTIAHVIFDTGSDVNLISVRSMGDSSFDEPYAAWTYTWGEQDSVHHAQADPRVDECIEEQRGSSWTGRWIPPRWYRSERVATVPIRTRKDKSLGTMWAWTDDRDDDEGKSIEESLGVDLSPEIKDPFCDSKQHNSIIVKCPSCRCRFSGKYRRGNLIRHMRAKHNAQRHAGRGRHRKLAYAIFLTGAQLACTIPLHSYDHCHGDPICRPPIASSSLLNGLPSFFGFLRHPTTNEFVLSALAYGATAMYQYHVNDGDGFQQLCLVVGLVTGFLLSVASPVGLNEQRATTSTMAVAITIALLVSAMGHAVHEMFSGKNTCKELILDEEKDGGNEV